MFNLGVAYAHGEGVTKDVAEAVRWYRKAADAGDTKAMFNLGVLYRKGEGVAQDPIDGVAFGPYTLAGLIWWFGFNCLD